MGASEKGVPRLRRLRAEDQPADPGDRAGTCRLSASEALTGAGQKANYADGTNLAKRQALFEFLDTGRSRGPEPLDRVRWSGDERVLDAGCGNGGWLVRLDGQARFWCGLDLSSGMLGDARARVGPAVPLVLGDVARLPFASRTFDVVLCLWVLYHVADPVYALREIDRVLAEDGMLIAATNSSRPRATDEIVSASLEAATGRRIDVWLPPLTFDAENAPELLDQVFARVEAAERVAAFAVPGPEPVLAAIESTRGPMEMTIGEPIDWPAFEAEARRLIEARIARDGVFRTEIVATTFLCSQGRRP